jgi:uncharacterized protein
MKSYDYAQRKGVEAISWERFSMLTRAIVEALAKEDIDIVIGIARAGLFPATAAACMLRRELYPVRISRRFNDEVSYEKPVWRVDVTDIVKGKRVAIVDEIADTGETMDLVKSRVLELDASHATSACLVAHSWASPRPDIIAFVSDAFVIFPWDEQIFINGSWLPHPEIEAGIKLQNNKKSIQAQATTGLAKTNNSDNP